MKLPKLSRKWLGLAVVAFIIWLILSLLIPPVSAALPLSTRESIAARYGLNPIYLQSSALPGSRTVYSQAFEIMCLPGVDREYVKESLTGINPFYKFSFVEPDPAKYRQKSDGLFYSNAIKTIVISEKNGQCTHCGCGTTGQCCPITLWIDENDPISPEAFGNIIEMECDHMIGPVSPDGSDTHQYSSEEVTTRYTEDSRTWGTVTINRFTGSGSYSWTVNI